MWYRKPAINWENDALPIGNGFMGGMIFGGIRQEKIQYNDKTLWEGGPIDGDPSTYSFGIREGAADHIESVRKKIWAGDSDSAQAEADEFLAGDYTNIGAYLNFGEVYLDFLIEENSVISNYRRELDLEEGIARVTYCYQGIEFKREYFCSYPDRVMVVRLTASKSGMQTFDVSASCAQNNNTITVNDNIITTEGILSINKMLFESQIKVINQGGSIQSFNDRIAISNADSVTILVKTGTNYANKYPTYRGNAPHSDVSGVVFRASQKDFNALKDTHINDYKKLFSRLKLDLGDLKSRIPTDELMQNYKENPDKSLEVLMYQYGRYLMISSSRQETLPANLQGVWNDSNNPAWRSGYQININIQMNYWMSYQTNLAECALCLIDYIETLRVPGRVTAEKHFGVTGGGWVANSTNTPFGYTAPGNKFTYGCAPNSAAFICQNLWEYYLYTCDEDLLREKIYPIIREVAEFWVKWLVPDKDASLVSIPSYSPEHGQLGVGTAMDQQMAHDIFTNVIDASEILKIDEEFRKTLVDKINNLSAPVIIGKSGRVLEWKSEEIDSLYNEQKDPVHRHISHLVALFPGKLINRDTPKWIEAARETLNKRGDESTGWSRSHKLNLWARALDGNRAYGILQGQLVGCTNSNLFDTHPPFQIDGNFGFVSGVSEMLVQSHLGVIDLLPALPDAWSDGSISGLCVRGCFELDIIWKNKDVNKLTVKSNKGNDCTVKCATFEKNNIQIMDLLNNSTVEFEQMGDFVSFNTEINGEYEIIIKAI